MAVFDGPPQTVREAIDMGWSGLRIQCGKCPHVGYILFYKIERRGKDHWLIGLLAARAHCRKCNSHRCPQFRRRYRLGEGERQRIADLG